MLSSEMPTLQQPLTPPKTEEESWKAVGSPPRKMSAQDSAWNSGIWNHDRRQSLKPEFSLFEEDDFEPLNDNVKTRSRSKSSSFVNAAALENDIWLPSQSVPDPTRRRSSTQPLLNSPWDEMPQLRERRFSQAPLVFEGEYDHLNMYYLLT